MAPRGRAAPPAKMAHRASAATPVGAAGPGSHPPAASIVDAHRFGEAADAPSPRRPLRPSARPSVRTRPGPLNPEKRESRVRAEPPVELVTTIRDWVEEAFRSAGANPVIGARLALLLRRAGAVDVTTFGVQTYLAPDDPKGPGWVAGLVRSLEPRIIGAALATEADLDVDTLQQRVAQALIASDAVLLPPTLVGAWARHRAVHDAARARGRFCFGLEPAVSDDPLKTAAFAWLERRGRSPWRTVASAWCAETAPAP